MLTQSQINQIDAKATEVLSSAYDSLNNLTPPISLTNILKAFRIKLKEGKFEDSAMSGAFNKITRTIYVSAHDPYTRQAFTMAHELGHFILHDELENELFFREQVINLDQEKNRLEQEANWFAASLLMPERMLKEYFELTQNVDELSLIFGVSPTAVYYRLKNLKLVE
jgi:Zn-dependent peptidase ImmA (M78 family)